jgi:peptidyl-dipeptidase A
LHVGRFDDVRVLCNVTPNERWMGTLLHEFGHAVYDRYLGENLPFFLREPAHTLTTEAIAMLFGRLSRNAAWLQIYANVPEDDARRADASAKNEARAQLLLLARWCLVMTHFERALYENPDRPDLNGLWWRLVQCYQGVTPPENRDAPDWAAKIHLALAPVYYHNYLLGEMFASQLENHLKARVLPAGSNPADYVSSPLVGAYLKRAVFAPGARLRWTN